MAAAESLSASLEDYLEAIFQIIRRKQAVRAKDIAKDLGVSSSSVTGALHSLADRRLINYAPYDVITLTEKGLAIAEDVVRRHEALREFFIKVLSVGEAEADEAACRMEHSLQPPLLERLVLFAKFVETCPRLELKWVEKFGYHCNNGVKRDECEMCISLTLAETRMKVSQE
ncbi:MAG: metal-dependent transcriptional regulator [Candidatus Glassbacteria bacterium]|nr:metal-dependent transcriptional regulator [Candidatus Glassbacteria bacterium]